MGGWLRHLALNAQVRTGFSPQIIVWLILAGVTAILALAFLAIACFVWLSWRYDALTAALVLAGLFVLLAVIALCAALIVRSRNRARARLELAERSNAGLLDPRLLALGMRLGQAIGWRRLLSLVAVAVLAAGVAKEWQGRDAEQPPPEP